MKPVPQLEKLATEIVGDGKDPNLYFVNRQGVIVAITRDEDHARAIAGAYGGRVLIEDRKTGIVWENEASLREQERLAREEDSGDGPVSNPSAPTKLRSKLLR